MTVRPDLRADAFLADERVVLRDRSIGVEANDLAEQSVHPLRLHAPFGYRALTERDEERAVTIEDETSTEVERRRERWRLMEDDLDVFDLRRGAVNELAASHRGVVHHGVLGLGVAPVDQTVLR